MGFPQKEDVSVLAPGVLSSSLQSTTCGFLSHPGSPPPRVMANFSVDLSAFLPHGFMVGNALFPDRRPKRFRSHLGTVRSKINEDVSIAVLVPVVADCNFVQVAEALHHFMVHTFRVRVFEIAACPIGAAFVTFGSCIEREAAIAHNPHPFEPYSLSFIKHDEGINLRYAPLDRVYWLMLVAFLLDCYNVAVIGRVVASFGTLTHQHESSNKARILIEVLVPSTNVVPESLLVVVGDEPGARVWDVPCFILQEDSVRQSPHEDPVPAFGVAAHPQPPPLPRWLGLAHPALVRQQAPLVQSNNLGDGIPDGAPAAAESVLENQLPVDEDANIVNPISDELPLQN